MGCRRSAQDGGPAWCLAQLECRRMDCEFQESTCSGSLRSVVGPVLFVGCSRFIEVLYKRYRDAVLLRCLHHHSHQCYRIKFIIYAFPSMKSNCTAPKAPTVPCLESDLPMSPSIHAPYKRSCKVLLYSMGLCCFYFAGLDTSMS